ncbi:hypothetical protein DEO72_LG8g1168 [Vigna unguiculata]|uniref:Uncharacterized protein n=1 Tax=Vigna unguiculata TaxID=3917 RepID=A0A4D6MTF0_VIGUN|nr:hypothetical protein DEO72_LG8g1167 [Vigna unguiculata]QCE03146.1 hypothetical protein DEO72_LG8g1168 [Vigna unguiculata]
MIRLSIGIKKIYSQLNLQNQFGLIETSTDGSGGFKDEHLMLCEIVAASGETLISALPQPASHPLHRQSCPYSGSLSQ